MNSLESVFISGNNLFLLTKCDGVLALEHKEFSDADTLGVKKSAQHDLVISPEMANNFSVEIHGDSILILPDRVNEINSMIKAETFGDWVCFYIDTDKKLLVHVQAKDDEYNFADYTHHNIVYKTAKDIQQEMQKMQEEQAKLLEGLADSLEALAKDTANIPADC